MTSEHWRRVSELFDQAVEMAPGERDAFLRRECAGDESLLRRVRQLVESDAQETEAAAPILEGGFLRPKRPTQQGDPLVLGEKLGPYRLVEEIGRGGMGMVYLATRDDETFQRKVAIKWLHSRLAGAQAKRRLQVERQILANLDHPSIAKLFDAGSTTDGTPYFVMEYIEGLNIDEHCETRGLSVNARIELFLEVCEAVQEAHRNLIVHRDLKPSNILVSEEGQPKLLDFGIAKLLSPEEMGLEDGQTEAWLRVLTPGYASPEQVRGEAITTAADVYSLGILLYKLLVGSQPFSFAGASLEDISKQLETKEAPRASDWIRTRLEEAEALEIAEKRGTTPQRLAGELAGDLDSILAKALRSSVQHRYLSVEQLSADLRRYLDGFPVKAHNGTFRYRTAKFISRHRWPLALASSALLLVGAFSISLAFLSLDLQRERDDKQEVIDFIVDVFESADPTRTIGEELTVLEALDQTEGRLGRLEHQPEVEATLRSVIGRIYQSVGASEKASAHFSRSLALEAERYGEESPEAALAHSQLGAALLDTGEFEAAIEEGKKAVFLLKEKNLSGGVLIEPLNRLVSTLCFVGDYEQASGPAAEVLTLAEQESGALCADENLGPLDPGAEVCLQLARSLINRGVVARRYEDLESAADLYRRAYVIQDRLLPPEHPELADVLSALAGIARQQDRNEEALDLYIRALEAQERLFGKDHPAIARTLNLLGGLLFNLERPEEALQNLRLSVEMLHRTWGVEHPRTIWAEVSLAKQLINHDLAEEAEQRLATGLEIWRVTDLGGECWVLAEAEGTLGLALATLGRVREAEPLIVQSFFTIHQELGSREASRQQRRVKHSLDRLVNFWREQGRNEMAEQLLLGAP